MAKQARTTSNVADLFEFHLFLRSLTDEQHKTLKAFFAYGSIGDKAKKRMLLGESPFTFEPYLAQGETYTLPPFADQGYAMLKEHYDAKRFGEALMVARELERIHYGPMDKAHTVKALEGKIKPPEPKAPAKPKAKSGKKVIAVTKAELDAAKSKAQAEAINLAPESK